jgi:26S proteasome regulatory subunit N2
MSSPFALAGIISALDEECSSLRQGALLRLHGLVDQYWAEMANVVSLIEELSEDVKFPGHKLAAALASKIFFHLEEYDEALRLALGAGSYFDVTIRSEYVETLVSRCIDKYVAAPETCDAAGSPEASLDPRLEAIVERMFLRCFNDGEFEHAIGIALEAQQLTKIKEVITNCPSSKRPQLLSYVAEANQILVKNTSYRNSVVRLLIVLHESFDEPDYLFLCHAWQMIGEVEGICQLLIRLVCGDENQMLLGFQLAFNLVESGSQKFIHDIIQSLNKREESNCSVKADIDGDVEHHVSRVRKLASILSIDGLWSDLQRSFLVSKCETDILILKNIKESIDGNRSSMLHNAIVITHSLMNAGTTDTTFLRENLDWMGKASNWAKFTATASIGVVHSGHTKNSIELLQPYLPSNQGVSSSPYSEGGALYALGLIHANRGKSQLQPAVIELLRDAIRHAGNSEPLQHGACLGIGLAAMESGDPQLYNELKTILFFDSAVAGEAAAYGIGLILAGHGASTQLARTATTELMAYAHETAHEKIIRSIVLSLALIGFGQENLAEPVIEQLCRDRDAIIRYGGMYAIGLAYVGTAHNSAVRRLLHVAVSDVSDDVRRAAVTCLGLVLFRSPRRVPTLVTLLAESFNPHVRYGACLAIGISCAGTGDPESLLLLQPMLSDPVDFVRQGCLLSLSLILMQQSEFNTPSVKWFREKIAKMVKDKYPSALTKLGAIVAAGIIDAGGRNCSVSLCSSGGFIRPSACIGIALWTQHWYWYPMLHFFSLALTPSVLVGVNKDFRLPTSFSVFCASTASKYAYPSKIKEKKEAKRERVVTAILSTTLKQQARDRMRDREKDHRDSYHSDAPDTVRLISSKNTQLNEGKSAEDESHSEKHHFLPNPSRRLDAQQVHCSFFFDQRYIPAVAKVRPTGVVMLKDCRPSESDVTVAINTLSLESLGCAEADLPLPFSWPN